VAGSYRAEVLDFLQASSSLKRFSAGRWAFASRAVKRQWSSSCISHCFLPTPVGLMTIGDDEGGAGAAARVAARGGVADGGHDVSMPPPGEVARFCGAGEGVVDMVVGRKRATMDASR
jgi:hypothetical protein